MTFKKWRPFWSYDVEKTERFLSDMAATGKQLTDVNIWTRMFSFEETERYKADFQIVYDKTESPLPHRLRESGWENVWREGNWRFLKNTSKTILSYPVREGILKRNRLHSNIAAVIAYLNGVQAFFIMTILFIIVSSSGSFEGEGQLWLGFGIPFVQSFVLIFLAVYARRKLRAFERKYFSSSIDKKTPVGETFTKWKFGWMYAPDLLEDWLSEMAAEGNHLVRVGWPGARFIFEEATPKCASFIYDFQLKSSPNYYDIHKSAGWQLKFTSPYSISKSSLWMKEYADDEEKPRMTYDLEEKKKHVRKVLLSSIGTTVFTIAIAIFVLRSNVLMYETDGWSLFGKVLVWAILISFISPLILSIRSLKYAIRMRKT